MSIRENSNFKVIKSKSPFCKSTMPLEEKNIDLLVTNILEEFNESSDSEKRLYRDKIKKWLLKYKKNADLKIDEKQVRDFIYEMY